jgi:hypothetical protein
MNEENHVLL